MAFFKNIISSEKTQSVQRTFCFVIAMLLHLHTKHNNTDFKHMHTNTPVIKSQVPDWAALKWNEDKRVKIVGLVFELVTLRNSSKIHILSSFSILGVYCKQVTLFLIINKEVQT